MPHLLKHWIGLLNLPLVLAALLTALAVACQLRGRRTAAWGLCLAAALIGYLASISLVGDALIGPLEARYASLPEDHPPPAARYVVVLGSDFRPRPGISLSAALDPDGLVRIFEAIRLLRRLSAAQLIVSDAAPAGSTDPAHGYTQFARQSGVPDAAIVPLDAALDTHGEARAIARLLGSSPFFLVTSAYHMPRAMWLAERAGTHPIAAPVGQHVRDMNADAGQLIPGSRGLSETEHALHEYIGLLAIRLGLD